MRRQARILLVEDSMMTLSMLKRCINDCQDLTVVGTAPDGLQGVEQYKRLTPDLVVMDIEMPVMNGIEALKAIRATGSAVPVIMFSTLTRHGAAATLQALSAGASDYTAKPAQSGGLQKAMRQIATELIPKIRALTFRSAPTAAKAPAPTRKPATTSRPDAVVVGCSTGGPNAIEKVLGSITTALPVPMFLVQHMPPRFTQVLAERLDTVTATTVVEAWDGMTARAGCCYIAPGGHHMKLHRQGGGTVIRIVDDEPINACRPSVEPLFLSALGVYGPRLLAVMLTGMGRDGLEGTRMISQAGCNVLVQDEETSVVWGMPGVVAQAGLATEILPIDRIGERIGSICRPQSRAQPSDTVASHR